MPDTQKLTNNYDSRSRTMISGEFVRFITPQQGVIARFTAPAAPQVLINLLKIETKRLEQERLKTEKEIISPHEFYPRRRPLKKLS